MESIFAADGGSTTQVNGILVARANKQRIWSIPTLVAQVYFSLQFYLIIPMMERIPPILFVGRMSK
ncbi:hypothetical protein BJP37_02220 [Moorena bouillonii PNG]|uniref:Uncharacterized protein n=1 Tax=Moorena bouillonii PNG TaxID=568701 RepID=A0A1U7MWH2_9CYAN|nr:hypothetical protein BJP37_02220 [Moorena bouillonii PNG]